MLKRGNSAGFLQSSTLWNPEQGNYPESGLSEEEHGKGSKLNGKLPIRARLNEKNESFYTFTEVRRCRAFFLPILFRRCILSLERRCTTFNIDTSREAHGFASLRCVTFPQSRHNFLKRYHAAIDYRLAPETVFPGPLHDVVSAYFRLIDDLHIPPENIIISGDSAGGGLSLALLMYLRDNNYPLPSGAVLMSPWVGKLSLDCYFYVQVSLHHKISR